MRFIALCCALSLLPALAQNPLQDAKDAALQGDYTAAIQILEPLAEQGDAKAQYNLALFYQGGLGLEKDRAKALALLEKSAAQHLPAAQLALGEMLLYGENGMTTYQAPDMQAQSTPNQAQRERGIAYITQAAEQDYAPAQQRLGELWLNGWKVSEPRGDVEKAAHWLSKAAEHGNADAQYSLAFLYLKGEGVAQDCDKALHWFEQSGDNGAWEAYGEISRLYAKGNCVTQDADQAAQWEAKAIQALEKQQKTQP